MFRMCSVCICCEKTRIAHRVAGRKLCKVFQFFKYSYARRIQGLDKMYFTNNRKISICIEIFSEKYNCKNIPLFSQQSSCFALNHFVHPCIDSVILVRTLTVLACWTMNTQARIPCTLRLDIIINHNVVNRIDQKTRTHTHTTLTLQYTNVYILVSYVHT